MYSLSPRLTANRQSTKFKGTGSAITRGLRHSQSMIRKIPTDVVLPGDSQNVKLRTMRPIILSNVEHVGKYLVLT